ncbi:MAG: hypothetical protein B6D64_01180 [Bacteroidetes bacterium 4484_276]|nr:MAG: hypothetical protein B6D64_01180 [Bacteroidetes bacterium 4484_276]OYT13272.1 MAG: hypothetical protein B6I19_06040 [Bacteroidetes bacterium 4572_114]
MFRKLNIKTLVIILVVLAAVILIIDMMGDKERSFRSEIIEVDTANITAVNITIPPGNVEIILSRTSGSGDWSVLSEGSKYPADINVVRNILSQLNDLKAERVAATSKDKWDQYEVSDSTGTRVILMDGKKEVAGLYIGKFSYAQPPQGSQQNQYQQQQRGKMTSFVRDVDEKEVYAVDGFLKMSYQNDVNSYRNKSLVNVNKDDISRLMFSYPDSEKFSLTKNNDQWLIEGQMADSANTVGYLNKIYRLTSSNFVDPSTIKTSDATYSLRIEGNNFSPIELMAYPSDTLTGYVVTSSINPGAEFDGFKSKLFEKLFVGQSEFLPGEE